MRRRPSVIGILLALSCTTLTACTGATATAHPVTTTTAATPATSTSDSAPAAPSPTTTATPATRASTRGCSNGRTAIPAGASTATIGDIDGDGKPDTEFYSDTTSPFTYGLRTSAGGVYLLEDDLAGPGVHSGWTAQVDVAVHVLTVLDDGRTATLHAFVDCRFVTTRDANGKPWTFGLDGFSDYGTGVACSDQNGGTLLQGVLAKKRPNGRYDIVWTTIDVTADGRTASASPEPPETRYSDLAAGDPRVRAAMGSSCGSTPEVHTSGR